MLQTYAEPVRIKAGQRGAYGAQKRAGSSAHPNQQTVRLHKVSPTHSIVQAVLDGDATLPAYGSMFVVGGDVIPVGQAVTVYGGSTGALTFTLMAPPVVYPGPIDPGTQINWSLFQTPVQFAYEPDLRGYAWTGPANANAAMTTLGGGVAEVAVVVDNVEPTDVLSEVLKLDDGWDGPGSIAPSLEAKLVSIEVFSHLASYLKDAEVEVDGSSGELTLSWYFDDDSCVSVTVLSDGRVVVLGARLGAAASPTVLTRDQLDRLGRVAVDAGLHRLHA